MSEATGSQIAAGTELFVRMAMQVDDEASSSLEVLFTFLMIFTALIVIGMIVMSLFSGIGYILPIWMLINSIQLIAYTVLLDIPAPSNSTFLLRRILDALRINGKEDLFEIDEEDSDSFQNSLLNGENNFDRLHLQVLGYRPWLYSNLAPLLFILIGFTVIWSIAVIT